MIIDATKMNYFAEMQVSFPNEETRKRKSESFEEDLGVIIDASTTGRNRVIRIAHEEEVSYGTEQ